MMEEIDVRDLLHVSQGEMQGIFKRLPQVLKTHARNTGLQYLDGEALAQVSGLSPTSEKVAVFGPGLEPGDG